VKPTLVIADASNYKRDIELWERTCSKQNISFHYTASDGAYIEQW